MRTNFNVQALDKRRPRETTLIQTTDPRSNIQVPKTLQWSEVTFLENWTLENENYPFQIQDPSQNLDLDFVQQLSNGTVRLRFRFPPSFDDPRFRSPIDLPQPSKQSPIPLKDRPASQCSSSKPRVPFPRSRRDLGLELQGVQTKSQVSTPCYTARQDSVVDQEDNNSRKTPSPSHSDLEAHGEPEDEPLVDPYKGLMTIKKEFTPDLEALGKEFDLEKNRVKREAYRANHTLDQKKEVLAKWKEFMKEISSNVPFFEYFENHFEWHKKSCVVTKTNWTKEDTKEVVRSSHPPLDKITFKHKKADVVASPFQHPTSEEVVVSKVIAQNNYTNQCLHVIGKQLERMEENVENKVILQSRSPSKPSPTLEKPLVKLPTTRQASLKTKDQIYLEICLQRMEELVKKEPVTPSPDTTSTSRLIVLDAHTASSSSSKASSDGEKEIEQLENQFRGLEVKRLYQPTPTTLTKNWYPRPTPPDQCFQTRTVH